MRGARWPQGKCARRAIAEAKQRTVNSTSGYTLWALSRSYFKGIKR
jgi:hypothetical protein